MLVPWREYIVLMVGALRKTNKSHLPGGPAPKRNSSEPTPVFHHLLHMLYTFSEGKWSHVK